MYIFEVYDHQDVALCDDDISNFFSEIPFISIQGETSEYDILLFSI